LEKIAKYFGVSVAYLRGEEPSQKPEYWLSDDNFTEDQMKYPEVQFVRLGLLAETIMEELIKSPPDSPIIADACKFAIETSLEQATYWLRFLKGDDTRSDGEIVLSGIRERLEEYLQKDINDRSRKTA
jgi:hypothetical protein